MMCIYLRTNKINGKQYVGQTVDMKRRDYQWYNVKAFYAGKIINSARKKYGIENFKTDILRECQTQDELNEWEIYYIKKLGTKIPNGYNLTDGGDGISGYEMTEEHKRRIGEAHKGIKPSEETRKKISESHKGIGLGVKRPEFAEKIKGKNNPFFGKTHKQETIDKIIKANKGKTAYNKGKTYEEQFGEEKAKEMKKRCINNAVPCIQYDLNGNFIKEWSCAKDAARELGLEYTNISKCANGKYKTAFGYIWKKKG